MHGRPHYDHTHVVLPCKPRKEKLYLVNTYCTLAVCVCACTTGEVYSEREEVRLRRETGLQIFVLSTSLKGSLLGFCYACTATKALI